MSNTFCSYTKEHRKSEVVAHLSGKRDFISRFKKAEGNREVNTQFVAQELLDALGGTSNIEANDICMTRLRILTKDPSRVDTNKLSEAPSVLGFVRRGTKGLEVVFGPGKVDDVQKELVRLTGVSPTTDVFNSDHFDTTTSFHVHIAPSSLHTEHSYSNSKSLEESLASADMAREEVNELVGMLDKIPAAHRTQKTSESVVATPLSASANLLVINGPNINMLGIREPAIYGHETYQSLLALCRSSALEAGFSKCSCFQSNHEGDLVDAIQDAYESFDGIVINPGAYTHTSVAILDAAKAVEIPMVEVHISEVDKREDFRQISYIRQACFETISGMGIQGYRKAIFDVAQRIGLENAS